MANILHRRSLRDGEGTAADSSLSAFASQVSNQIVDDFKLSCTDPVVLFVNIHTMLIYGILYLWFEFFPFGTPSLLLLFFSLALLANSRLIQYLAAYTGSMPSSSHVSSDFPVPNWPLLASSQRLTSESVAFFGILGGAVLSVVAYLLWLYFVYQPRLADPSVTVQPEDRLRPGQVGAVCIPICLFIFAWASRQR